MFFHFIIRTPLTVVMGTVHDIDAMVPTKGVRLGNKSLIVLNKPSAIQLGTAHNNLKQSKSSQGSGIGDNDPR